MKPCFRFPSVWAATRTLVLEISSVPRKPTRFLSSPSRIRVPFFLLFGFNKGALNQKGQKGTTQEPSQCRKRPLSKGQRRSELFRSPYRIWV